MASDTAAENNLPAFIWDEALIRRYDLSGPRYTSYPTAVEFTPNYSIEDMVKAAGRSKASGGKTGAGLTFQENGYFGVRCFARKLL